MRRYKVTYHEIADYTLTVDAADEDSAWEKAHGILLGGGNYEGAIQLKAPNGIGIECDVLTSDWTFKEI